MTIFLYWKLWPYSYIEDYDRILILKTMTIFVYWRLWPYSYIENFDHILILKTMTIFLYWKLWPYSYIENYDHIFILTDFKTKRRNSESKNFCLLHTQLIFKTSTNPTWTSNANCFIKDFKVLYFSTLLLPSWTHVISLVGTTY